MSKTLYFGCDHAGFTLKKEVLTVADKLGYHITDFGTDSEESVDYPDFALQVIKALKKDPAGLGILICGTGIGMSITANRFHHIRAALCHLPIEAKVCREHNNANILCLGGRTLSSQTAEELTRIFLTSTFEGGRHQKRIDKIDALTC